MVQYPTTSVTTIIPNNFRIVFDMSSSSVTSFFKRFTWPLASRPEQPPAIDTASAQAFRISIATIAELDARRGCKPLVLSAAKAKEVPKEWVTEKLEKRRSTLLFL